MKYGRSRERARQDEGSLLFLGEDLYTSACICLGAAIFTLECNASAQKDCLIQVCVCVRDTLAFGGWFSATPFRALAL